MHSINYFQKYLCNVIFSPYQMKKFQLNLMCEMKVWKYIKSTVCTV